MATILPNPNTKSNSMSFGTKILSANPFNGMSQFYYIKAPCHQSTRTQGFQLAPNEIKSNYDYEIPMDMFDKSSVDMTTKKIELCEGYNELYQHILNYKKSNMDTKIITIGGDNSISAGTIAGMNEAYMKQYGSVVFSELMVLWIDAFPDMDNFTTSKNKDLNDMPVASLLGLCGTAFTKNKLLLNKNQLIYYGLRDDNNLENVMENDIPFYTVKKINAINEIIIESIKEQIGDRPLHVVVDLKVFDKTVCPSVIPVNDNGLKIEQVEKLLCTLKSNIVAMDLVELNPLVGTQNDVNVTRETLKYILRRTFDIKEKSINIFTEDSQFLIFRSEEQEDPHTDIGWYILRGMSLEDRNNLIQMIPNDDIISIDINGNDDMEDGTYLITKTTMNEQYEKSYYASKLITDIALFPQEKSLMAFELINA